MVENKELSRELVAHRAHELYVERGTISRSDVEEWLRAEKELSQSPITDPAKSDKGQIKASRANRWLATKRVARVGCRVIAPATFIASECTIDERQGRVWRPNS
jgi:hypothetical protein